MKIIPYRNTGRSVFTNNYEDWNNEERESKGVLLVSEPILPKTFSWEVYNEIQRTRRL